jgi:hypothetical protein
MGYADYSKASITTGGGSPSFAPAKVRRLFGIPRRYFRAKSMQVIEKAEDSGITCPRVRESIALQDLG